MESLNAANFENVVLSNNIVCILFGAANPQSNQMKDVLKEVAEKENYNKFKYCQCSIDEEGNSNVARQFSVSSVPTVLFFRNGNEIGRVIGANPAQLMQQLEKIVKDNETIEQRLKSLVNQESVMIFIKGTPQEPRCKFTRAFIALLNQLEAKYGYFDILSDNEVRESLKLFSNWPTYPQLYVKGKLVGGLDIAQDLHESGELEPMLKS